ncbi:MAG TPA: type IV pili methyl-accepting chemotaxis transducer N-terminal domain-containing protein, partial [Roseateles sp.]
GKSGTDGGLPAGQGGLLSLQRHGTLSGLVMFGFIGAAVSIGLMLCNAGRSTAQVRAVDQALTNSQRMAKAASNVLLGNRAACAELRESVTALSGVVGNLRTGEGGVLAIAPDVVRPTLDALWPMVERVGKNANLLQEQQEALAHVDQALGVINSQSGDLLEGAEAASAQALLSGSPATEVSAVGQLVMLTQRIGKSANELLVQDGVSPTAIFMLGKDLNSFKLIIEALLNGNPEMRLNAVRDSVLRERLQALLASYEQTHVQGSVILNRLKGMVAAREAQIAILKDSEPLREGLEQAAAELAEAGSAGIVLNLSMLISSVALLAGVFGFMRLHLLVQEQAAASRVMKAQSA